MTHKITDEMTVTAAMIDAGVRFIARELGMQRPAGHIPLADLYRVMRNLEPRSVDECRQYGPIQRPSGNFEHRRHGEYATYLHGRKTDRLEPLPLKYQRTCNGSHFVEDERRGEKDRRSGICDLFLYGLRVGRTGLSESVLRTDARRRSTDPYK
jgi:hypothetical protein